jgi:hypothetical protein
MKNIHVLSTDKPSRLYLTTHEYIFEKGYALSTDECQNKNIYITDDSEIKEGDWYLVELFKITGESDGFHIEKCTKLDDVWCNNFDVISTRHKDNCKKIILTTDQDLIKDGVQAIDEEFLQWFVKNPTCEYVEVEVDLSKHNGKFQTKYGWKIIIPKEEPKQETLEEASEKYSREVWGVYYDDVHPDIAITQTQGEISVKDFSRGAKWQQEQDKKMYSEEEMIKILISYLHYLTTNDNRTSEEWFKQFKKK